MTYEELAVEFEDLGFAIEREDSDLEPPEISLCKLLNVLCRELAGKEK